MKFRYLKYFLSAGLLSLLPATAWALSQQTTLGLLYLTQSQNADGQGRVGPNEYRFGSDLVNGLILKAFT